MTESVLDDVPGLGETRRKALLKHFGSLKRLRAASVEEIAAVPGIGPRTAAAVVAALHDAAQMPRQPSTSPPAKCSIRPTRPSDASRASGGDDVTAADRTRRARDRWS